MEIYTAGFTKWSAREFFDTLKTNEVGHVIDVRLHNSSQLAGFAKRDDLEYFLERIVGASYRHEPLLAPTDEILKPYKSGNMEWQEYEERFDALMRSRRIEDHIDPTEFTATRSLLLCSEHEASRCHRRLVTQYLSHTWGDVEAVHLHR